MADFMASKANRRAMSVRSFTSPSINCSTALDVSIALQRFQREARFTVSWGLPRVPGQNNVAVSPSLRVHDGTFDALRLRTAPGRSLPSPFSSMRRSGKMGQPLNVLLAQT